MATATKKKTSANGSDPAVKKSVEEELKELHLPEINVQEAIIHIQGISPLISNRFSEKARQMMLDKQQKKATGARKAKEPEELFKASLYVVAGRENWAFERVGRYYMPGVMFKKCAVTATRFLGRDLPATRARGAFYVVGDPIIDFASISMREDYVRNATGVADLRYRGQFNDWEADVHVQYDADNISLEQLAQLFQRGGYSCGIGDYRPSSPGGGEFGRFRVTEIRAAGGK